MARRGKSVCWPDQVEEAPRRARNNKRGISPSARRGPAVTFAGPTTEPKERPQRSRISSARIESVESVAAPRHRPRSSVSAERPAGVAAAGSLGPAGPLRRPRPDSEPRASSSRRAEAPDDRLIGRSTPTSPEPPAVMVFLGRKEKRERERRLLASMDAVQQDLGKVAHYDNAAFGQSQSDGLEDVGVSVVDASKLEDKSHKPQDTDLIFLDAYIGDPLLRSLIQVQERLEQPPVHAEPVCPSIGEVVQEVTRGLEPSRNPESRELLLLLRSRQLRTLLETHDRVIAARRLHQERSRHEEASGIKRPPLLGAMPSNDDKPAEAVRVVGLMRQPDEPLGLTIQVDENGNLIIARILGGSTAARQGLMRPGEVILEVNGKLVRNPDELQHAIQDAKENLTLKLAPGIASDGSKPIKSKCYMRALFDYEPTEDTLLPCREVGLSFQKGDILQIVDQADPNWWQARRIEGDDLGPPGLVPSLELEERRKAFVPPEADFVHKISICGTRISKKKKRKMYQSKSNGEFDAAELLLYEEVARMPPIRRKTLALVGPRGVGRRTLKNRLINSDPEKFGTIVPFTSRPPRVLEENGKSYWFTDRELMEKDIREHQYLEYGEHGGHLYGTKLDSVRELIHAGRMCVLDCSPAALKILHNSTEFTPYVIFIAAPGMEQLKSLYDLGRSTGASSRNLTEDDLKSTVEESAALQRAYEKYIDLVIVNEDFDHTFRQVVAALESLEQKDQWVPVNWIY